MARLKKLNVIVNLDGSVDVDDWTWGPERVKSAQGVARCCREGRDVEEGSDDDDCMCSCCQVSRAIYKAQQPAKPAKKAATKDKAPAKKAPAKKRRKRGAK